MNFSGTAPDIFNRMFEKVEQIHEYCKGDMALDIYEKFIQDNESSVCFSSLGRHLLYLSTRYPMQENAFDNKLMSLISKKRGLSKEKINVLFRDYKSFVNSSFEHGDYITYIVAGA